jgi:kynureninase
MDSSWQTTLEHARRLDAGDALAGFRDGFYCPAGTIYMDGNSLGLLSHSAENAVLDALAVWRDKAIGGWLDADPPWFTLGEELGRLQAAIVGAAPSEVVVTGSTTVNLHNLLGSFYRTVRTDRRRILADELNFPSDIYAIRSHLVLRGMSPDEDLILVRSRDGRTIATEDVIAVITDDIALVVLPSVLYRSGQLLDLPRLTRAAHEKGALIGFDLSHSAGVVPHQLSQWDVDFAFWCNYKYLNGGPGCTASIYVNQRHHGTAPGLAGWWGYRKDRQFDMRLDWEGAADAGAWQVGTIPVLATAAVAGALRTTLEAGIEAIRRKSLGLTDYLIYLVETKLGSHDSRFAVGTPREHASRGGHVALEHPEAVQIVKALRARGVVPDFRPPDVIRLAPVPLYCSFEDVWQTVKHLSVIVDRGEHLSYAPERGTVA